MEKTNEENCIDELKDLEKRIRKEWIETYILGMLTGVLLFLWIIFIISLYNGPGVFP